MNKSTQPKVVDALNDLISTCSDGAQGFEQASSAIREEDPVLARQLKDYSSERATFADQLKSQVRLLGGEPSDGGSTAGAVHRAWMGLKDAITSRSKPQIIKECERGEDHALKSYKEALQDKDLPSNIRNVVQAQQSRVQAAHDHVRRLEIATQS